MEGKKSTMAPSATTVAQFLGLVEFTLDRRTSTEKRRLNSGRPVSRLLAELLAVACRWATAYPTVNNLALALRSLTAAERRQEFLLTELYDERLGLADQALSIRSLVVTQLEVSATRAEIDDFRRLLQALRDLPANSSETEHVIARLFDDRARFDPAISRVLSQIIDGDRSDPIAIHFASGGEPTSATVQLAAALLRAWAARGDGTNAREAYEQLRSTLESFFSLRLRDCVGETQQYNPRLHEFGFGDLPSSTVEVVRPSVELLQSGESSVVVKALVKPSRS
jgi:hypothetical protein